MCVFVKNRNGQPLMPTSPRKARILLRSGRAFVVGHHPFTIQLSSASGGNLQPLTLGVDAGYKTIGLSVVGPTREVYSAEIQMLEGQVERNKKRSMYRRQRRGRKRYRKPRFSNRKKAKGWLAPSIEHKLDTHMKAIERLRGALPITRTVIEVASFDIQKIKNPEIEGTGYQHGEKYGFWNLREYVFHRDGHCCQNPDCKTNSSHPILQLHHIGYYKGDRTDRAGNCITLCILCHSAANHAEGGFLCGWKPRVPSFRPATFMTMVRWRMVDLIESDHTYGYITKAKRIALKLPKSHATDAFCVADGRDQRRFGTLYFRHRRKNNRSLETFYDAKIIDTRSGKAVAGAALSCGRRTRNRNQSEENLRCYRGATKTKGRRQIRRQRYAIRPGDQVRFEGAFYSAVGVQNKGAYLKMTDGTNTLVKNIRYIEVVFHQKTLMRQTGAAIHPRS